MTISTEATANNERGTPIRPGLLNAGDSLWQACIDQLAQELPEQQFNTWIKPLVAQPTRWPAPRPACGRRTRAMYNPLFIYGGVGLGKTHLMHAVGNALLATSPMTPAGAVPACRAVHFDVVKNYQRKTFDELKAKYHSLDLLLIDDVQFFAGKDRTQEEFFNAFEALLAKKRAHHHDQRHLPQGAGGHR
jgi:chromosomal replication initiation ATPase DnaA